MLQDNATRRHDNPYDEPVFSPFVQARTWQLVAAVVVVCMFSILGGPPLWRGTRSSDEFGEDGGSYSTLRRGRRVREGGRRDWS